jgi:hypothetical protein
MIFPEHTFLEDNIAIIHQQDLYPVDDIIYSIKEEYQWQDIY